MGVEVCPVHITEFKSSSIHVGVMSYLSQPRGLKRKHPEDAEDEDPPRRMYNPADYIEERKKMFDITNDKLRKTEGEKDPIILRQVLMNNVFRRLRQEMERDGIQVNNPVPSNWSSNQVSNLDLDPPNPSLDIFSINYSNNTNGVDRPPTPAVIPQSDYGTNSEANYSSEHYRCLMDIDDSPRATPFVRTSYDRVEPGALWTDDNDRLSSLNWSSVLKSTNFDATNGSSDCALSEDANSSTSLHLLMPAVPGIETYLNTLNAYSASSSSSPNANSLSGNTSPASGSSPSSSEDEIFGDVDLTLYDYDYTPLSPPSVAMAPLTAEELMWSLSNDQKPANTDDRDYLASVRT
ncbi:SERTA domain-containing protein [Caerostris darwini]|uniref:SERTA domain-containing protein n=1 Tax=Caerostris darwini TaxID=1538125 RepID=A0AAV4M344_9ARAC|nr:SERTA domain-containing protein [Caerostris darwini]